jgi:hypothetical protein
MLTLTRVPLALVVAVLVELEETVAEEAVTPWEETGVRLHLPILLGHPRLAQEYLEVMLAVAEEAVGLRAAQVAGAVLLGALCILMEITLEETQQQTRALLLAGRLTVLTAIGLLAVEVLVLLLFAIHEHR